MAPSAESSLVGAGPPPTTNKTTPKRRRSSLTSSFSRKTIAFAVNWERSIVDRYWTNPTTPLPPVKAAVVVGPVPEPTRVDFDTSTNTPHQRTTRRSSRARAAAVVQQHQEKALAVSRAVTVATNTTSTNSSHGNAVIVPPEDESQQQHRQGHPSTIGPLTQARSLPRSVSTDNASAILKIEGAPASSSSSCDSSVGSSSNAAIGGDIPSSAATPSQPESSRRASTRDQNVTPVNLVRARVRYDMEMVPAVQPNLEGSVVYFPQNRKVRLCSRPFVSEDPLPP